MLTEMGEAMKEGGKIDLNTSQEDLDRKINEGIQKREIKKLRNVYYQSLQEYHTSRKFKEYITLGCAQRCLANFREDDLTKTETQCLRTCFNKYYRHIIHTNQLFTYIQSDDDKKQEIEGKWKEQKMEII